MEETTETPKRIARCLTCSHEWIPRKQDAENPSRCTECKSRDVKWRDQCTPAELRTRDDPEPEPADERDPEPITNQEPEPGLEKEPEKVEKETEKETEPQPPENPEEVKKEIQKELDKLPKVNGLGLVLIIAGFAAVGVVFALFRRGKKNSPAPKPAQDNSGEIERQKEEDLIQRIRQNNARRI